MSVVVVFVLVATGHTFAASAHDVVVLDASVVVCKVWLLWLWYLSQCGLCQ